MRRRAAIKVRRLWHGHRRRLPAAVAGLGLLAVMAHSAFGGDGPPAQAPTRLEVCDAARRTTDEIADRHPEVPRESLEAVEEQACSRDPVPAPSAKPSAFAPSPGCHLLPGADRRPPAPVRAAEPSRPIPFFAARSGRLPPTGTPRVGGVRLPAGSRCGPFWSTDAGVPGGLGLARELAAVFPSTGLWPVLWSWAGEEPDGYVNGGGDVTRVRSLDAETILRRGWSANGGEKRPFPGLAAAEPAAKRLAVEPFGRTLRASRVEQIPGGPILMLVPVNRPADVIAVLRPDNTIYFRDDALAAVLRSWEERFGAVVAGLGPGTAELVVGAPPRDDGQIDRLVAEHATFAPDAWSAADLERLLRSDRTTPGTTSSRYWAFGWPD